MYTKQNCLTKIGEIAFQTSSTGSEVGEKAKKKIVDLQLNWVEEIVVQNCFIFYQLRNNFLVIVPKRRSQTKTLIIWAWILWQKN